MSRCERKLFALVVGLAAVAAAIWLQPAAAEDAAQPGAEIFKAGFAERDITPAIGAEQPGGYGKSFNRSIHDPCKVRAAVFDDGIDQVAIVGIDALFIRHPSVAAARKQIYEKCGIPAANIMIGASHSHSAGPMGMTLPGEYDHADEFVRKLAYEMSSMADAEYLHKVESAIAEAVCDAHERRVAARAAAGLGLAPGVAFNRRFRMKSGLSFTHPRAGNPEIVEPAGPIDPQVGVLGAWDLDGKFLGCVVNFACHATTGPGGVSADYIGYVEKTIRGLMGEQAGFVFMNGMSGDITQVNNASPYKLKEFGEISARFVGGTVGAEAVKVLLGLEQSAGAEMPVATASKLLKIKRRVPSAARLARSRELAEKDPKTVDATEWTFAKEILLLDARLAKEPVANVELQAVQVGPAVFCSCPAEYFCQYGLDIKAASPFRFTFPVSLANDCVGYVPTEEALGQRGGGYETRLTGYSNLEPTAGRQMADTLIELTKDLKPGPTPQPPALPPFQDKAWTYGDVPPELD